MSERFKNPVIKYTTNDLKTLPGSKLYFYETGTTTPKLTYQDVGLTVPHAHPVVSDGAGIFAPIFLDGVYRVELKNIAGVTQPKWPVDNVGSESSGSVQGPNSSTIGAIAVFDNTSGTRLANGPVPTNGGVSLITAPAIGTAGYLRLNSDESLARLSQAQVRVDLSLNNVDNTSDVNKPLSTAATNALNLKANIDSPTFTGTVSGISKAMVGLGNADNTSDADKPVSTAQGVAIAARALSTDLSSNNDNAKGAALIGYRGQSLREHLDRIEKNNTFVPGRCMGAVTTNQWGVRQINILGDSISHGANAPDIPNDAWTGVFRKIANSEFGGGNYGFVGINATISNAEGTYQDYHLVELTGTWTAQDTSQVGEDDLIGGYSYKSNVAASVLKITVPAVHKFYTIWYKGLVGGGTYQQKINGANTSIETTNVVFPGGFYRSTAFPIVDNGSGQCVIELVVAGDGPVQIMGAGYFDDEFKFQVNNFSQSGRRIEYLGDSVIDNVVGGCELLIFALGHNDQAAVGASQTTIRAKMDRIITNANNNNVKVLFLDFCWEGATSSFMRTELDRAYKLILRSEIIKFPDLFYLNGTIPTSSYLIDTLEFLSDGSHPSVFGHRVIAEAVAKTLGYSISSKRQAEINCNRWNPVAPINGWVNSGGVTAYRKEGNSLAIRITVTGASKTTDTIATLPASIVNDALFYAPFYDSTGELFKIAIGAGSGPSVNFATSATITWPITALIYVPLANSSSFIS